MPPRRQIGDGTFRWRTMEGETLTLPQMETKHIFNSMKMCFNHLAEVWGGKPVWFVQEYPDYFDQAKAAPAHLAGVIVMFLAEIERRGDLPEKYLEPYRAIVDQIRPKLEPGKRNLLPMPGPRRRIA
jgi:hypothetical protein